MKKLLTLLSLASLWLLTGSFTSGQCNYVLSRGYAVTIAGTSNLRPWQETVGTVTGDLVADRNPDGSLTVSSMRIRMVVLSIRSDMGRAMDAKTYSALKAAAYPEILFFLDEPVRLNPIKGAFPVKGYLQLAGVCKPVIMLVRTFTQGQDGLSFEGSQAIDMTDFGIKPPSAFFGAMKAAPRITIYFKTLFT